VVAAWKRPRTIRTTPAETLGGANIAAIRYVGNAPLTRAVIVRAGLVMFCASALLALLPSVAHTITPNPLGYGLLLGAFGVGAVCGAVVMQRARGRWPTETLVTAAIAVLGVTTVAVAAVHTLPGLMLLLLISGGAWITFISLMNAFIQTLAPDWVRARVLALFMLATQGGLAAGSVLWGAIGSWASVGTALMVGGVTTLAATSLRRIARLPDEIADVSPWNHWRMPVILQSATPDLDEGPVLVTAEYEVDPSHANAFLNAMQAYGRVRRRDGASRWGIFRDLERPHIYLESFVVTSWAEHLRQHERFTQADSALEQDIQRHVRSGPTVRHLIYAESDDESSSG
jgi:MFS family permease